MRANAQGNNPLFFWSGFGGLECFGEELVQRNVTASL